MVVGSIETPTDVVFVVEGTAGCGAYFNDIRQNYVLPTLEHFNGGPLDDKQQDYGVERNGTLFALVIFRSADWLPSNIVDCHGPIQSASRLSKTIDKIEFYGGQAEFHSFIAEGLATAMHCFDDFTELRGPEIVTKKHCVLICNSSPYGLPITDTPNYEGLHLEQLASMMIERGISLSVMSPRKIPALVSIFDKAGGDCQTMQTKLYAKDPRHLVLLQGYGLQERAATPPPALRENLSLPTAAVAQIPTETTAANLPLGRASPNPMVRPNLPTNIAPTSLPMQRIATPTIPAAVTVSSMPRPGQMQQQAPFGVGTPPNVTLRNTNPAAATGMGTERAPNAVPRWQGPGQTVMTGAANNIGPGINVNVRQTFVSQASVNPAMLNQGMKQTMGMNTGNAGVLNQPNVMQQQQQQQQQQQIQNQQIQAQVQAQVQAQRLQNQQQQQQLQAQQAALAQAQLQRLGGLDNQAQQVQQQASVPNQNLAAQQQQQPQPNVQAAVNLQNIPTNVNNAQMGAQMQPGMANVNNLNPQVVQNQQLGNVMMGNVMQTPGGAAPPNLINPANQAQQQQQGQAPLPSRERVSIWQGILEWQEKPRELQKPARQVQCQVSAAVVQPGEAEVKAENWPPKLIMQLIPKQLISTFGGAYLKNARSVLFHPTNCEALEALSKVMASGYAGCVHFTTPPNRQPCEIKVLMLLYSPEKRAYVGFIPNDQAGFVERIKSVIQQQKNKQGQMAGPMMGPGGQPAQGVNPSFIAAQQAGAGAGPNTQAGFLLTQSNISAMVGGQISAAAPMVSAQQVNVPSSQPTTTQATVGLLGNPNLQHAAGAGTPGIRQMGAMPEMNAGAVNVSNANNASNVGTAAPGAGISQMEAERQQNLLKIQQLQQTLQAAQQKELQFKAQQQQFRQMDIQQLQNRHMRPGAPGTAAQMQANPGLRHLLQQQQQAAQQQGQVGFRPQGLILQQGNRMQQPGMPQQQQQQAQQQQQSQQQQQGQGHFNNLGLLDLI